MDKDREKTACEAILSLLQSSPPRSPLLSDPRSPLFFAQNHRFRFIQRMMPVARAPMEPSARK
jgi:hypothetical protein